MFTKRLFYLVFFALVVFSTTGIVSAAAEESVVSSEVILYDEMVDTLQILEERSDGDLEVINLREFGNEGGVSEAGRDLYVAKIGNGDKDIWVQGRIHGNEPYGTNGTLRIIENLIEEKDSSYEEMMEELTIHFIPMYNPDGAERNERGTRILDPETGVFGPQQDLNRDWHEDRFNMVETASYFEYWASIQPEFTMDVHHHGTPNFHESDIPVTMSLGIALAPGGPTLPYLTNGEEYETVAKQANVLMYDALEAYPQFTVDHYRVGQNRTGEIDHRGGISSGAMRGEHINYNGHNPDGHSNPGVFLETAGQFLDGEREPLIKQNIVALHAFLYGLASGELYDQDPDRFYGEIPHPPLESYTTDWDGTFPVDNPRPALYLETSAADVKELFEYYDEAGKFENDQVARSLDVHLSAVNHYEQNEQMDKFLKHMPGLNLLLDQQSEFMTDVTYSTLTAYTDYLIEQN
ncbi:M14 family zinc carboxypeptidase [Virgibacillus oceani]